MQSRKWQEVMPEKQEVMPEKQNKPWRHQVMQRNRTLSHRREEQRYITRKRYAQTAFHVDHAGSNIEDDEMVQEIRGKLQESWVTEAIAVESFKKKEVIYSVKCYP